MSAEQVKPFLSWPAPGKSLVIRLDYSAVDRLNVEVMRGFGVTRRRGTETGGLLIGKIDRRTEPVIHIQEFEVVPCEYASGPSYILSANDKQKFKDAIARWQPSLDRELYAVGYFRSHTRDGFELDEKDAALFREYFRDPLDVALLIKPFATRPAAAGFFFQKKGSLVTASSPLEFTFAPPGQQQEEPATQSPEPLPVAPPVRPKVVESPPAPVRMSSPAPIERPMFTLAQQERSGNWGRWLSWLAFGVALLAFGGACGYEYAGVQARKGAFAADGSMILRSDWYSVQLQVSRVDSNLMVKWDRDAAPIQTAMHGVLTVTEGSNSKDVKLGFAELRNGAAMYPHVGSEVRFRLEVFFKDNRSFVESVEFRQLK